MWTDENPGGPWTTYFGCLGFLATIGALALLVVAIFVARVWLDY